MDKILENSERLQAFESFLADFIRERDAIPEQLAEMRASGREKTVRYKETLAQKLLFNMVEEMLRRHKIVE